MMKIKPKIDICNRITSNHKCTPAKNVRYSLNNNDISRNSDDNDFFFYQPLFENILILKEKFLKKSAFSKNLDVAKIEKELSQKGINARFKNDLNIAKFVQNGLKDIENAGYKTPSNIFIVPPYSIRGAGGAAIMFSKEKKKLAPILLPKTVEKLSGDRINEKFQLKIYSTNNPHYYIHHEVGHWLHFQEKPSRIECEKIWQKADQEMIMNEVSKMALKLNDGTEFVAEVFAGLIDGKKYSKHIMDIYKELKGPTPR